MLAALGGTLMAVSWRSPSALLFITWCLCQKLETLVRSIFAVGKVGGGWGGGACRSCVCVCCKNMASNLPTSVPTSGCFISVYLCLVKHLLQFFPVTSLTITTSDGFEREKK